MNLVVPRSGPCNCIHSEQSRRAIDNGHGVLLFSNGPHILPQGAEGGAERDYLPQLTLCWARQGRDVVDIIQRAPLLNFLNLTDSKASLDLCALVVQ